jgi:hypothetical protein
MSRINQSQEQETRFLIYIDILGFDNLAKEISKKSGMISEKSVREQFVKVINDKLVKAEQKQEIVYQSFSQRDDWLIAVKSIDLVLKVIHDLLDNQIDYKGYETIPLEIAVGSVEYDKGSQFDTANMIYDNATLQFLKTPLTDLYREWFKAKNSCSITNSFVIFTSAAYAAMSYFDKELFDAVESGKGQEKCQFFAVRDISRLKQRGQVFSFLQEIGKSPTSWFHRIDCAYVPPNEFQSILDTLEQHKIVFLVGDPEIGKTYTAARILWEYYLKGFNSIWIPGAEDSQREIARQKLSEFSIENHTITFFDDPFGARKYEDSTELTKTIINTIKRVQQLDSRVIISSREELFKSLLASINSDCDLSDIIVTLRLMKPSYSIIKMQEILLNWAKEFNCCWLRNEAVTLYVISEALKRLSTPFSLWDFASSSSNCVTFYELDSIFKEKSKNVKLSFAEEITHMTLDKVLFLTLTVIFTREKSDVIKRNYDQICNHLGFKQNRWDNAFEKFRSQLKEKVAFSQAPITQTEYCRFTHPSYEDAVINSWNKIELKEFILQIYAYFITNGDDLAKGCCGLTLIRNLPDLSFEKEAKDLLLPLLNDKSIEPRLCVVLGLEQNFKNLPIKISIELIRTALNDKNSDIRHRCLCIVSNNFSLIPLCESNSIFSKALDDRATLVRFEAVRCVKFNSNAFTCDVVQKALIENEKFRCQKGWLTNYLSIFLCDDLFKPYEEARRRIEQVKNQEIRMYLKAVYLLGTEGCELTGKVDSCSLHVGKNIMYGPKGTDVSCCEIEIGIGERQGGSQSSKTSIALFRVKTARKTNDNQVTFRTIALPISENFDPWVKELYNYFLERGNNQVFPFNRQKVWDYITTHQTFDGLYYRIREYRFSPNSDLKSPKLTCQKHRRLLKLVGLRRLRTYELIDKYNFDCQDLEIYPAINNMTNNQLKQTQIDKQDWHRYIHKLCTFE